MYRSFAAFYVHESNRFAHAAAYAVAEAPARAYNPLWISGPSGTGKSLLLGCIAAGTTRNEWLRVQHQTLLDQVPARVVTKADVLLLDDAEALRHDCEAFTAVDRLVLQMVSSSKQVVVTSRVDYEDMHAECCDHRLSELPWSLFVEVSTGCTLY
ncbi:chromosomal replication initiation protein [Gordonia terrae C-6]|uniref:Chromosomal replication initiation protein n=1 Tax=Gordonia terrae C-6 TaxID=1316928 RepID=R7YDF3_9ACTN|nr:DnaA/Hda family protein [Gordonia terrae]EON33764.1 chromosomal replication initiation protein [Gordonia terrae C-6]